MKKQVSIVIPGLQIGTHKTISHFLTALRTTSRQHELHVYIHTWDVEENDIWLKGLLNIIALCPGVIPHVEKEAYNSKEFLSFADTFAKELGLQTKNPHHPKMLKRLFMNYSLIKCLAAVKADGRDDDFIIKLRTNIEFEGKFGKDSFWPKFNQYVSGYFYHNMPIEHHTSDINDVLFTDFSSHYAVSEKFLASGFSTFNQIYGTDPKEFAYRWGQLHLSYANRYMAEKLSDDNQADFWTMEMLCPIEGSLLLNDYIQMFFPGTIIHGILFLPEDVHFLSGRASLYEIDKRSVRLIQTGLIDYAWEEKAKGYVIDQFEYSKALALSPTNPDRLELVV